MATKLGTLTLDMVTRIGNFIGPMRQAENQATSSANSIVESFDVASLAAKAFGAVVAGVSVGVMVAFVNQTIDTGNEIKKLFPAYQMLQCMTFSIMPKVLKLLELVWSNLQIK